MNLTENNTWMLTRKYYIPIVNAVEFTKELPIDPYVLGLFLGNGGLSQRSKHYYKRT